jgi:TatD DNase family protein
MILIDAHCHLESREYPVVEEVLARAREQGLVHAIVVGLLQKAGDFGDALEVARAHPDFLSPTMGIHPHDAAIATPEDWAELERRCREPDVVAVGEAGLDYYYQHSPPEVQAEAFRRQCQLAKAVGKPLVVHVRDAHDECAEILKSEGLHDGQIHCFTGNTDEARRYLDLGFHLSLSGIVTYKKSEALQEAARFAPLERLLVETDSPYLAPVPHRGKKNEPGFVLETAKKVAELKGLDADEVALACARNTVRLMRLKVELPEG